MTVVVDVPVVVADERRRRRRRRHLGGPGGDVVARPGRRAPGALALVGHEPVEALGVDVRGRRRPPPRGSGRAGSRTCRRAGTRRRPRPGPRARERSSTSPSRRWPWARVRANCSASAPSTSATSAAALAELRVGVAPAGHHLGGEPRDRVRRQADVVALAHRAADEPAQDVVAPLVAGAHPVGGQEGHRPAVVGQHAQRAVVALARARRSGRCGPRPRRSAAGRRRSRRRTAGPAGSPSAAPARRRCRCSGWGAALRVPSAARSYCMKTRFQYSRKRSVPVEGPAVRPEGRAAVDVELGVGAAGAGGPGLQKFSDSPSAWMRSRGIPRLDPELDRLVVGRHAGHALEHRDPDLLGVEPEDLRGELEGVLDRPAP